MKKSSEMNPIENLLVLLVLSSTKPNLENSYTRTLSDCAEGICGTCFISRSRKKSEFAFLRLTIRHTLKTECKCL